MCVCEMPEKEQNTQKSNKCWECSQFNYSYQIIVPGVSENSKQYKYQKKISIPRYVTSNCVKLNTKKKHCKKPGGKNILPIEEQEYKFCQTFH